MRDDERNISACLSGDREAADELVRKYQRKLYSFIYMMVGDMDATNDLVQETFCRALKGLGGFRGESSFRTWLYRIALNASRSYFRRGDRLEVEIPRSLRDGKAGPLADAIQRQRREIVRRGLAGLPERQREALVCRAYDGLSCRETAEVMGCSEGAVKAHYHHGVRRLREIVRKGTS